MCPADDFRVSLWKENLFLFMMTMGVVVSRPLGNRGMTSPSRTDWDPMTDVVPEELEASYNQTLRYNPVLRRLLAAFVTPVHHPPPPSPTREDLPKGGRGKGAKSRGGAANKRKKEGPSVDDDSWGTSGEFELDWIDPETTCSKASPPTTPVKEEKDHRGQNGGASPSASLGTPSALAISVTSTPTKQLSSPIRPTPLVRGTQHTHNEGWKWKAALRAC